MELVKPLSFLQYVDLILPKLNDKSCATRLAGIASSFSETFCQMKALHKKFSNTVWITATASLNMRIDNDSDLKSSAWMLFLLANDFVSRALKTKDDLVVANVVLTLSVDWILTTTVDLDGPVWGAEFEARRAADSKNVTRLSLSSDLNADDNVQTMTVTSDKTTMKYHHQSQINA